MAKKDSKDRLFLFRIAGQKVDAKKMMFLTEYGVSLEADSENEDTMDDSYSTGGSLENTISATAKMDYRDSFADEVEDAVRDGIIYEAWEIESKVEGKGVNAGKFKAKYYQGKFKKFESKGEVKGVDEYETEFNVFGKYQRGFATIPETIKTKLELAGYRFHNTTKDDPATEVTQNIPQPTVDTEDMEDSSDDMMSGVAKPTNVQAVPNAKSVSISAE
ncbi:phage major tail protein, TP901-1 family [Staphylococcus pseudintermedius]|nr:phage major tail protein, TP901-1 family [Staphylococcus pseudintermedius]